MQTSGGRYGKKRLIRKMKIFQQKIQIKEQINTILCQDNVFDKIFLLYQLKITTIR